MPEKPALPELWYYLGKTYFQLNEQEKALTAFNQAISLAGDSLSEALAAFYYDRAVVLAQAQKYQAAQQDFLKALLLMPEILAQQDAQNRPLNLLGNLREILASHLTPSAIDSAQAQGYLRRAEQYIAAGDSNRAVRVCEQALALDSLQAGAYLLKARALAMMKKTEEAKQSLEQAQALVSPQEEAQRLYLLALVYRLQFKSREAQATLDEALLRYPEEANFYQEKAFWALQAKQNEEALRFLDEALRLDSTLTQTRGERAALYLEMGQYEAVLKDGQALLAQDETDVLGLYYQGRAYEALGAIEEALEAYMAILWLFPNEAEVRQRASDLQKKRKP
ncbi:MAG: tetratricopeptide repeat protein [Microscillaceae bacterium]|nr:tetratricopeptide repeat protein [Microscillaceae bacterium]